MIRLAVAFGCIQQDQIMLFSTAAFTFELNGPSLFVRIGNREAYVSREIDQPRTFFARRSDAGGTEVWGFGWYAVTNPVQKTLARAS